jgi:hypothetical protein
VKQWIVLGLALAVILLTCAACSSGKAAVRTQTVPAATNQAGLQHSYGLDKPWILANSSESATSGGQAYADRGNFSAPVTATPPGTIFASMDASQPAPDRMVVRTGNVQMVVGSISQAMDGVTRIAGVYSGYVVTSQQGLQGERNVGSISIRIDAQYFDRAFADLRALAKSVTSESTTSQDVTEEYIDLDAKEKNLEATETQLRKIMEAATKTEDVLSIQRELTSVRTEIEQAKGRMQYLERTSSTSLIQVQMEEAVLALKFTANKVGVSTDEEIRFTSEVAGGFPPYSYQWDFGDGQNSNEVSPAHSYKNAGTYYVILKVSDDKGYANTVSRDNYINVRSTWKPASVATGAWQGLSAFSRVLVNILIWVGIFSPVWIVILAIVWFTSWRRKRKKA